QRLRDERRQVAQGANVRSDQFVGAAAFLGQSCGQPQQRYQLGGEGFCGGNTDFRASLSQQAPIGFSYQGAAGHVADGQGAQVALGLGMAQCGQSIGSLTGLGDGNKEGIRRYSYLPVAELTGHFYLTWQAG